MAAATKKCAHCGTQVELDARHCPNCPASFEEDDSGVPSRRRRSSRIPQPVLWLAILAVIGLGMWRFINFVMTWADNQTSNNPLTEMTQALNDGKTSSVGNVSPNIHAPITEEPPADASSSDEPDSSAIMISHAEPEKPARRPGRRRKAGAAEPPAAARAASSDEWKLRGTVYDLVSLKPAAGVPMTLKDAETSRVIETITDAKGRYRLTVPALPGRGYSVIFGSPNYASSYLNPGTEGIRDKDEAYRRKLAADLNHALTPPYPLEGYGAAPIVTDYYLAPRQQ